MSLSNMQYEAIVSGYEHTRDKNHHILEERRAQVYRECPELQELDSSVGSTSVTQARLLLDGDDSALATLRSSLKEIADRRKKLLAAVGYPEDYLEPIYDCPDCQDTGYRQTSDGLREKCHCFRRQEISLLYEQSNIQDMVSRENFSTLSYSYYQGEDLERFQKAVQICQNFVQNFKQDYQNLFFYGTVGTGKSFLSGCVANELLGQGMSVIYFSASGLFETLAKYAFSTKEKDALSAFYNDLYNCDLVIVDDLGTEVTNSFVTSQLFACLNERHLRKHSTIISTNLSLEELRDRYSDRVFSRVTSNYTLCKLTGPDIRMQRKVANHAKES
ncbi:MAG: ATP-binding protein [Acetatifactor sp.]|nr:ATP-binding protein [Acetatifactor sp.]